MNVHSFDCDRRYQPQRSHHSGPADMLGFAPRAPRARRWSRQPCSSSGQPRRWPPAGRRLGDDHHCSGRSGHLQQWHHRCDGGSYTKREPAAAMGHRGRLVEGRQLLSSVGGAWQQRSLYLATCWFRTVPTAAGPTRGSGKKPWEPCGVPLRIATQFRLPTQEEPSPSVESLDVSART
jgi:hypothetical protein